MVERQRVSEVLRHDIEMVCRDGSGRGHRLSTVYVYDRAEPFAVTVVFRTRGMELPWMFSRELLALGQVSLVGEGDVQVWPSADEHGDPFVMLRLSSPDGSLLLEATAEQIHGFLEASTDLVPRGTEADHLDLDALVLAMLDR